MSDSSRSRKLPLSSSPIAGDGHANSGRRGSAAGTNSKNNLTGKKCQKCRIILEKK